MFLSLALTACLAAACEASCRPTSPPILASTKLPDQCPLIQYVPKWDFSSYVGRFYRQFVSLDYGEKECAGVCVTETVIRRGDGTFGAEAFCQLRDGGLRKVGGGDFVEDPQNPGVILSDDGFQLYLLGLGDGFFVFYGCIPGCPRTDLIFVETADPTLSSRVLEEVIEVLARNGFKITDLNRILNHEGCS